MFMAAQYWEIRPLNSTCFWPAGRDGDWLEELAVSNREQFGLH